MTPLLSRQQAAAFLGVPEKTLAAWAYKRMGPPYFRVGKWTRYREGDLLAWLERRVVETNNRSGP